MVFKGTYRNKCTSFALPCNNGSGAHKKANVMKVLDEALALLARDVFFNVQVGGQTQQSPTLEKTSG
jgi:hypothetical protein